MKKIKLTQNEMVLVSNEDYKKLNQFKWYALKMGGFFRAVRWGVQINRKRKLIYMHREIMKAGKNVFIDHINGNPLDNRRRNLRICTHQQNLFNRRRPQKDNKLGVKGVCWHKGRKKFQAQIGVNNKVVYLGGFSTLKNADLAYRNAEKKYFKEFARK